MMAEERDFGLVIEFLSRINRRIISLEHESVLLEKSISVLDKKNNTTYQLLNSEMDGVKATLLELKTKIKNYNNVMISLTKYLKNSLKKEELNALSSCIDELKFEEYITKADVYRIF
jgi:hypothetical protein